MNKKYEIKHNGYLLLLLTTFLFVFVLLIELIDFIAHSFRANWLMYIGLLLLSTVISFPVLFTTLKIRFDNETIQVVKTLGTRMMFKYSEISKVVVIRPDECEKETNLITRVKVYADRKKFYVDSKMKNYDKLWHNIISKVDGEKIVYEVNWFTKSRT